jgi:hypothetical protein
MVKLRMTREEFRAHWLSFQNMPFDCLFAGAIEDIVALDFLNYEGLGYPPSCLEGAALIWGNVLATQLGMTWATWSGSELLLEHSEPGSRVTIWPFARVLETHEQSHPQFGKFAWLLGRAIRDLLQDGNLSDEAEAWARGILKNWERTGTPWS